MDKAIIILPIFLIVLWGCTSIPKEFKPVNGSLNKTVGEPCSNVISEIQEKWAIHNKIHCFYFNKSLIRKIVNNKGCLIGLDTSEIILLFGEPNRKQKNYLGYNIDKNCDEASDFYGEYSLNFKIDFNNNPNVISSVKFSKVTVLD